MRPAFGRRKEQFFAQLLLIGKSSISQTVRALVPYILQARFWIASSQPTVRELMAQARVAVVISGTEDSILGVGS